MDVIPGMKQVQERKYLCKQTTIISHEQQYTPIVRRLHTETTNVHSAHIYIFFIFFIFLSHCTYLRKKGETKRRRNKKDNNGCVGAT